VVLSMRCYNCGRDLPDNSKVCLGCGKRVGESASKSKDTFTGTAPNNKIKKNRENRFRIPLFIGLMISLIYLLILYFLANR
jgi:uncharacterized membrane protein YvbJ